MNLLHYTPLRPLSDFVDIFWLHEGAPPPHPRERLLPMGTVELVINLRGPTAAVCDRHHPDLVHHLLGPIICGPHSEPFVIPTADQASILGVHFKPGGAFPFLRLRADELHNRHVSLDSLWGASAAALHDRLREARTPAARFRILEQSLLAQADRPLARHPAVAFALRQFQDIPRAERIAEVTGRVGLSPRRFSQLFAEEVGLTPKLFCRVRRFQEVVRFIDSRRRFAWSNLALACGYYDQAHFINDFQSFSGLTPTAYLREKGEHPNHVPLAD
jgi:AraC-like DNA-binding protein